jgi:large exoprotein involved in heme utilization and adhesion
MERNNVITVIANNLRLQDGAQLIASTESSGNSGNIYVDAQTVSISGLTVISDSPRLPAGMLANTTDGSSGKGGNITINAGSLTVEEGGAMSARSAGTGIAGNVVLDISNRLLIRDGDIDTVSTQTSGGDITINAREIILDRDGDITTRAFNGQGAGGNIDITALRHIIALDDSDIIASSSQGQGGNISLKTPRFFGEDFTIASLEADPDVLDGNNSVDVNASGINDGNVEIPNTTSLENDLSNLPDTFIASDQLIANSCIVRSEDGQGTLIATGRDGLSTNPRSELTISLPTGAVQAIAASTEAQPQPSEVSIVEPTGIYQMGDGRWVMAQACL